MWFVWSHETEVAFTNVPLVIAQEAFALGEDSTSCSNKNNMS
jgi:hypothetical protein